jgi:O-methyltransferase domain
VVPTHPQRLLEPAIADHRRIWDLWFCSLVLPAVAASDELGIFSLLAECPLPTEDVAARLSLTREWAEVLLGVLAVKELVRVQDGKFHLTDTARCFLLPESPYYSGFSLRRFAERDGVMERLKRALENTGPNSDVYVVRDWQSGELSPEVAQRGVRTMHGLSFPSAVGMACSADFSGVRRLLDVGGGSGGFSIALAQRYPELHCTVADLPVVCELTHSYIAQYGVEGQVDTRPLNMFFEPWPVGYDAIFMSCVLHDWDLDHRVELIKRSFAALPPGGRVFIHEMLVSDAADGPFGPAMFSLQMRIGTLGKQFSAPELRQVLEAAGFRDVSVQHSHGYFSLMAARKP